MLRADITRQRDPAPRGHYGSDAGGSAVLRSLGSRSDDLQFLTVRHYRAALVLAMVSLLFFLGSTVAVAGSPVDDIAGQLACQCGCGYTVLACGGAMQCDVGDQMVALISQKVKKGETKEEILAYFVNQYGEKVLAAPTKQGFNLTAWITPFLAVGAGGTVVYFVLREWLANRRIREENEPPAPADLGGYGERIDRELEQFG